MYLYTGGNGGESGIPTYGTSSSGPHLSRQVSRCSICQKELAFYLGPICDECKAKLEPMREMSADEVGRALSEFIRKKLAKIEPVGDVRSRGIDLTETATEPHEHQGSLVSEPHADVQQGALSMDVDGSDSPVLASGVGTIQRDGNTGHDDQ